MAKLNKEEFLNTVSYRTLYDFLKSYKGLKNISNCYKAAYLQNKEEATQFGCLIIACENSDEESMVTDQNYKKIKRMVEKYETEIKDLYGMKTINLIRYSYWNKNWYLKEKK